jgi:PAS domain S-box-containing protein
MDNNGKVGNIAENNYTILLVDDDDVDIMSFERAIKKTGLKYNLHVCKNASETLISITRNQYDCIFLDYLLPGFDGLELLKKIREFNVLTPIAVMTSQGDEKLAVQMIKNGAFDYFPKAEISPDYIEKVILNGLRIGEIEAQRLKAELAIKENNSRLTAIIESTQNYIYALDKKLCFISFNSSFKNKVKLDKNIDIQIGQHIEEIVDDREILYHYRQCLAGESTTSIEEYQLNNNYTCLETTYNPIKIEGEVTGVAIFSKDITENKKFQKELLQARNDAINSAKAKTDFLSNMSHEIRTPMNAIMGLTELLLEEDLQGTIQENLKSIRYSADNLLVIINDILDFSKIEAGKITFESIEFDIRERMSELYKTFEYRSKEKGLDFIITMDEAIPNILKGDPYRLNQILFNLVGNAIKFTSKGSITIDINLLSSKADQALVAFTVTDTGIGIPEHKHSKIFESFTQAYTDTTRKFGGTGLGLAITKNLTLLQNGNINIKSRVGQGTTFSVELPFEISKLKEIKKEVEKQEIYDLSKYKILVVEDNVMNQFVAKQFFKRWNTDVVIANNGVEAIEILSTRDDFSLVLMDLQMPEMSGFQAAEMIRAPNTTVKNSDIPIIALSADAFSETRKKVIEANMNDFVTKPFNPEELYQKVLKYVTQRPANSKIR